MRREIHCQGIVPQGLVSKSGSGFASISRMRLKFFLLELEAHLRVGLKWAMVVGFSGAAIMYLVQLALRIFFRYSLPGLDGYIQYGFVVAALLGAGYAVKENENIKIELFRSLAKKTLGAESKCHPGFSSHLIDIVGFLRLHFGDYGGEAQKCLHHPALFLFIFCFPNLLSNQSDGFRSIGIWGTEARYRFFRKNFIIADFSPSVIPAQAGIHKKGIYFAVDSRRRGACPWPSPGQALAKAGK